MDDSCGCLIMQIAVIEEQKRAAENEAAENVENEAKTTDTDPSVPEPAPRNDGFDEKPDINDIPMEENQVDGYLFIFASSAFFLSNCSCFECSRYYYTKCH